MAFTAILKYFMFVCQAEHCIFCSVAKSCQTLQLHELQPHQASLSSLYPRACSNSCPLSRWCHPTILSSAALFSSCPQSFPPSESFPVSRLFALAGQNIGASTLASVLPMNIQGWFPLGRLVWSPLCPRDSQESSSAPLFGAYWIRMCPG